MNPVPPPCLYISIRHICMAALDARKRTKDTKRCRCANKRELAPYVSLLFVFSLMSESDITAESSCECFRERERERLGRVRWGGRERLGWVRWGGRETDREDYRRLSCARLTPSASHALTCAGTFVKRNFCFLWGISSLSLPTPR